MRIPITVYEEVTPNMTVLTGVEYVLKNVEGKLYMVGTI